MHRAPGIEIQKFSRESFDTRATGGRADCGADKRRKEGRKKGTRSEGKP